MADTYWLLPHDCPALRRALAAMVCIHMHESDPYRLHPWSQHLKWSMQALIASDDYRDIYISSEPPIATRIALCFTGASDLQKSSIGIAHITDAKTLFQRAVSQHRASNLTVGELSRLSFLVNTWI